MDLKKVAIFGLLVLVVLAITIPPVSAWWGGLGWGGWGGWWW